MPYQFNYLPQGAPSEVKKHDGELGDRVECLDGTPDDGGPPLPWDSGGRAIRMDGLPTWVQWPRAAVQDLLYTRRFSVSERLHRLIEELEPGVHQFKPVEFRAKRATFSRYWWQVCNRIDSVHEAKTNYDRRWSTTPGPPPVKFLRLSPPSDKQPRLVFSLEKIGYIHFWVDKYTKMGPLMSRLAHDRFVEEGITGVEYSLWPEA